MKLCGVEVPSDRGLEGTSDADVALHAVIDALLGAAAQGDLGELFPSDEPRWSDTDSQDLLASARSTVEGAGFRIEGIDVTIIAESVRVAPHRRRMRLTLADALGIDEAVVSVKATSTDGMGHIGREEGIGATAVATLSVAGQE